MKKCAFSLAEVLITLGVIGAVSAMTLPPVIKHYQKQVTVNKLKKVYTTLNQAIKLSEIDNGEYQTWEKYPNISQTEYSEKYFQPYLKILKVCKNYKDCGYPNNYPFKYLKGSAFGADFPATSYILQDGTFVWIMISYGSTANNRIIVDLNAGSPPNLMSKDIFVFSRNNKGKIEGFKGSDNCNKADTNLLGISCAFEIIKNNWQIPDNYP